MSTPSDEVVMNRISNGVSSRTVFSAALLGALVGAAPRPHPDAPSQVNVRLSEWKVELSQQTIATGAVRFAVTNAGSIAQGLEGEGQGIEKEIETIQPGATDTLTLTLKPGTYEVYCPVGEDSHKKLGMETHLKVAGVTGSGSSGYGASEMRDSHESMSDSHETMAKVQAIAVTSGGPVIQILPGPFPFPDSAAPILQAFGDEREGLEAQGKNGPHSHNVASIAGRCSFPAGGNGANRDPVGGGAG